MTILEISLLIICIYLIFTVMQLKARVNSLTNEYKPQQSKILDNSVKEELLALIHDGQDVKAVKKVRETLGLSLLEAKQYVDALKVGMKK